MAAGSTYEASSHDKIRRRACGYEAAEISVIVPVCNESRNMQALLKRLYRSWSFARPLSKSFLLTTVQPTIRSAFCAPPMPPILAFWRYR